MLLLRLLHNQHLLLNQALPQGILVPPQIPPLAPARSRYHSKNPSSSVPVVTTLLTATRTTLWWTVGYASNPNVSIVPTRKHAYASTQRGQQSQTWVSASPIPIPYIKCWRKMASHPCCHLYNSPSNLRFFAIFANFVKSATRSGLVIINMTKNCEKSQLTKKIVRLAIFRNFRKFC